MDAMPQDDGLKVRFGIRIRDRIVSGGKLEVPASQMPDFQAFVDAAPAART